MLVWLDQKLFGNGHGMKSPYWDDRYYWLKGEFYQWTGWHGAQLQSFQWTVPSPGERRVLCGRVFKPFSHTRKWGRVRVSWAWEDLPKGIDAANRELRILEGELGNADYGARLYKPLRIVA